MFLFWFCAKQAAPSVGMGVSLVGVGDNTECYAVPSQFKGKSSQKIQNRGSRELSANARGEMFGSLVHQGQVVRSD